jgi:hypothetical protein
LTEEKLAKINNKKRFFLNTYNIKIPYDVHRTLWISVCAPRITLQAENVIQLH